MTYRQILYLKRMLGIGTTELVRRFPGQERAVSVAALSELPVEQLRSVLAADPPLLTEVMACKASMAEDD